jgi:hypothetical protein
MELELNGYPWKWKDDVSETIAKHKEEPVSRGVRLVGSLRLSAGIDHDVVETLESEQAARVRDQCVPSFCHCSLPNDTRTQSIDL